LKIGLYQIFQIWNIYIPVGNTGGESPRHTHGRNFVAKCGGTVYCEINEVIGSMQK